MDLLGYTNGTARGDYLNQKRRRAGLSLDDLAERVEVDYHTVDAWMYHGARPSNDNLVKIAESLADKIEGSTTSGITLELRALYWISDVASLLAEHIGAEAVDEAIGRLQNGQVRLFGPGKEQWSVKKARGVRQGNAGAVGRGGLRIEYQYRPVLLPWARV